MTRIKSAFSCCASQDGLDAEARHARIVTVTNGPYHGRLAQKYHGNPPDYRDIAQQPLIRLDEKNPADFHLSIEASNQSSRPASPNSSLVSVPSTRVTDLTALQTGDTALTSARGSMERTLTYESRPPSYYSNLRRSPSPISSAGLNSDAERDEVWQHPVMRSNWLETLRQEARRHAAFVEASGEPITISARAADPR
ncbi:hypothetical protein A1O3_08895 [Capronia epimyces CBS 606.96]|uniref:Uncharacterized protein n=1 Tax=Capronia epimyces CBS 606.96 TaxID=1182542 RepID=W9XGQ6_9EURO|nr:uncharacterized protein A1O3_08895 [Capronia epimyces CBS 606.96]EXJ79393.1 hypothetical protein A1O3_08895 [Capronia epimyces CBS 606.96]